MENVKNRLPTARLDHQPQPPSPTLADAVKNAITECRKEVFDSAKFNWSRGSEERSHTSTYFEGLVHGALGVGTWLMGSAGFLLVEVPVNAAISSAQHLIKG